MKYSVFTFENSAFVYVEVVWDRQSIERGLSGYQSIHSDYGMFFDLDRTADHLFWMHGVRFPLDIVFFDEFVTVVGILKNVPADSNELRSVGKLSRYVLEVNAGWTDANGVVTGMKGFLH